jgi:hypothetical protein
LWYNENTHLNGYLNGELIFLSHTYMARRKLEDRTTRKLSKKGGSYIVTLPIEVVRALGWKSSQKLTVTRSGQKVIIKDWKE